MIKAIAKSLVSITALFATSLLPLSLDNASIWEADEEGIIVKDEYVLTLSLKVPQVIDNMESRGYRKVQRQTISGKFYVLWDAEGGYRFKTEGFYNKNFKVRGKNVTYTGYADETIIYPRFNYIGSNRTGKFIKPCLSTSLILEPSYAIEDVNEDNSFYLVLSGFGVSAMKYGERVITSFSGYATGSQGCGCMDSGHTSPTRIASSTGPSDEPDDVVATYGTWNMRWKKRTRR